MNTREARDFALAHIAALRRRSWDELQRYGLCEDFILAPDGSFGGE